MSSNNTARDLELLTQLSEIAIELGWVIAVPPSEKTDGIIMGNVKFVKSFDDLLPDEEKLDVLIHESQLDEDMKEEINNNIEMSDDEIEKEILATNVVPISSNKKGGGGYVH